MTWPTRYGGSIFDVPEPFESLRFHHFGFERSSSRPFPDSSWPLIVISPFLTDRLLDLFDLADREAMLISRWDELQGLSPEALSPWDVYRAAGDAEGAKARLKHGVLTVTVPRAEPAEEARRIA